MRALELTSKDKGDDMKQAAVLDPTLTCSVVCCGFKLFNKSSVPQGVMLGPQCCGFLLGSKFKQEKSLVPAKLKGVEKTKAALVFGNNIMVT